MKQVLKYIFAFIVAVLLQVLVFNSINLFGYVNIYIYMAFIVSLPIGLSREVQMLLAFLLGLCIDIFCNTLGMHIFACVFIAFFRNSIISRASSKQELPAGISPSIKTLGTGVFLKYLFAMVFLHHLVLFPLEDPAFVNPLRTLLLVVCSVPVSYAVLLCFYLPKKS